MEGFLNRKIWKIISISLAIFVSVFMLAGCGKNDEDNSKNHVYKATDITVSDGFAVDSFNLYPYGDGFCVYGMISADLLPFEQPEVEEEASEEIIEPTPTPTPTATPTPPNAYELWRQKTEDVNNIIPQQSCEYLAETKHNDMDEDESDSEEQAEYSPKLYGREYFYIFDNEGNEINKFYYDLFDEQFLNVVFAPSGEIITLGYGMIIDENIINNSENNDYIYYDAEHFGKLRIFSKDGELINQIRIDDEPDVKKLDGVMPNYENGGKYSVFADANNVFVYAAGYMLTYDYKLNLLSVMNKSKVNPNYSEAKSVIDHDGNIYINYLDYSTWNYYIAKCDPRKGTIDKGITPLDDNYIERVFPGVDSQFIIFKNGLIYEYNFGEQDGNPLVDFTASNIGTNSVKAIAELDATHLAAIYYSIEDESNHLSYLTKVNPEDVVVKTTITLATINSNQDLNQAVVNFNKANEKYNIRIIDYNALYGDSSWVASDAVIEKLNVDIISGNMPDILVTSNSLLSSISINPYIRKDLIEDLTPYIEADPDMDMSDFDSNVFDIFSKDGKLYSLVPSYSVMTNVAKKSVVGNKKTWTMQDAIELMDKYDSVSFEDFASRDEVLSYMMVRAGEQFVDTEKATCSFDSEEFREAIRFLEKTPESANFLDSDYTYDERYKKNKIIAQSATIDNFNYYCFYQYYDFGEPITCVGFPTSVGCGSCISPTIKLSMSSKSKNKEGCWEFLRYFLTDAYQGKKSTWKEYFPVKLSWLDQKYELATEPPVWEYTDYLTGKTMVNPITYEKNGEWVPMPGLKQEEVDEVRDLLSRVTHSNECDLKILTIIKDETKEYYNGNASLDDVCNRIQSRVQIYLYEIQ